MCGETESLLVVCQTTHFRIVSNSYNIFEHEFETATCPKKTR